jgi:hypothetical protein
MESLLTEFDGSHFLLLILDQRVSLLSPGSARNTHRIHFVEIAEHFNKISSAASKMRSSFLISQVQVIRFANAVGWLIRIAAEFRCDNTARSRNEPAAVAWVAAPALSVDDWSAGAERNALCAVRWLLPVLPPAAHLPRRAPSLRGSSVKHRGRGGHRAKSPVTHPFPHY